MSTDIREQAQHVPESPDTGQSPDNGRTPYGAETVDLRDEKIKSLSAYVETLTYQVETLKNQLSEQWHRHTEFKRNLVKVAREYAERYGWCEEVDNALREIGLEDYLNRTYHITVTLKFDYSTYSLTESAPDTEDVLDTLYHMDKHQLNDALREWDYEVSDGA